METSRPEPAVAVAEAEAEPEAAEADDAAWVAMREDDEAGEPSLFEGLDGAEAAEDDDALPPPAYSPAAARAEAVPERSADTFVAPAARPAGTPSPEALQRLQAAVSKVPGRPAQAPEQARPASAAPTAAERARFGINTLINRMTGGEHERSSYGSPRQQPPVQAKPVPHEAEDEAHDPDHERIEVPAFLRRQAN